MSGVRLHLLRTVPLDGIGLDVIAADRAAGAEVIVVFLHDAVHEGVRRRSAASDPGILLSADDCRRRGLDVPAEWTVDHAGIVDLLARAERAACW